MKWLYRFLLFLFLVPAQTLFVEKLSVGGVQPDLALVLVYTLSWSAGEAGGLLWGGALGGVIDFFSIGILSVNFFLKTVVGFASGMLGRSLLTLSLVWNILLFFLISLLHDLIGIFLVGGVEEGWSLPATVGGEVVARAVYNTLIASILLFFFARGKGEREIGHAGVVFSARGDTRSSG